jgi:hypothetical protein
MGREHDARQNRHLLALGQSLEKALGPIPAARV